MNPLVWPALRGLFSIFRAHRKRKFQKEAEMKMKTFLKAFVDRKDSASWAMVGSLILQFACSKVPVVCEMLTGVAQGVFGMDLPTLLGGGMFYGFMRATSKALKTEASVEAVKE